jgi:hypothetical protein
MDWEDAGLPLEGALADRASRPASCVGAQTVLSRGYGLRIWPPSVGLGMCRAQRSRASTHDRLRP